MCGCSKGWACHGTSSDYKVQYSYTYRFPIPMNAFVLVCSFYSDFVESFWKTNSDCSIFLVSGATWKLIESFVLYYISCFLCTSYIQILCNCPSIGVSTVYDKSNGVLYVGPCVAAASTHIIHTNISRMVHDTRIAGMAGDTHRRLYIRCKQNVCHHIELGELLDSWYRDDNHVLPHLQVNNNRHVQYNYKYIYFGTNKENWVDQDLKWGLSDRVRIEKAKG